MLLKACPGFKYFVSLCITGFLFSKDTYKQLVSLCTSHALLHVPPPQIVRTVAVHKGSTVIPRTHSAGDFISVFHQLVPMAKDRLKTPFLLLHQCLETTWKPIFFSFSKRPTTPSLHTCMLAKIAANTKLVNFSLSVQGYEWMGAKQTQKCVP